MPSNAPSATERRSYRSKHRERQARQTRERILAAAATEFTRNGYAATPIRAIAARAAVSVPTIELAFGTKAMLLQAAISFSIRGDDSPKTMLDRPWAAEALNASSVDEFLAIFAHALVEAEERSAGLITAAFEAANQDESMSALTERLRAQRAEAAAWLVDGLATRAGLRGTVTYEQAIDTVWLLMDPHGYRALTRDRGWTPPRFQEWFIVSVHRLLVADGLAPPAAHKKTKPHKAPRRVSKG